MINFMYYWRPKLERAVQRLIDRLTKITWTGFGRTDNPPPISTERVLYEPSDGEAIALD